MKSIVDIVLNAQSDLMPDPVDTANSALEPAGCCYEWHEHEHTSPSVQVQAEHLLDAAGSAELAKHAIDVVAQQLQEPSAPG